MAQEIKKPISHVTINYEDGTRELMEQYALVGLSGDTWFSVMLAPPKSAAKIKMNNMLADLSGKLLASISQQRQEG